MQLLKGGGNGKGKTERTPPRGNTTGREPIPILSNIMLNELDKELIARELNSVRYADDCIIVVRSKCGSQSCYEFNIKLD